MKNLGLILVMLLGMTAIIAQPQRGGQRVSMEERQANELKQLKSALELDQVQEKAIIDLQSDFAKKSKELRAGMTQDSDRKAMRDKMNTLRKTYDTNVKKVLNEEQKLKYDELIAKRNQQMQQGKKQGERKKKSY